jgi:NADH-quinone oxidoreductase subunit C/D
MATREKILEALGNRFGGRVSPDAAADQATVIVAPGDLLEIARHAKEDPELAFDLAMDLCGVDWPKREKRFETVVHLYSTKKNHRLRIKVPLAATDPTSPSLAGLWPTLDWFEREAFDLMGIRFDGHSNLRRILCHEGFQGHALRKDYDPGQRWQCADPDVQVPEKVLGQKEVQEHFETQVLNLGPSHPATHGTLRISVRLAGETIVGSECEIGYLHRCFEKMSETHTYGQVIPYTDRLNYCSPMLNGNGYARASETMLGITIPKRAERVRVILGELSRIMDHLVCIGANLVDLGALTNFWYLFRPREEIYGLIEACSGARLTTSYVRIGGLAADVPDDFVPRVKELLRTIPTHIADVDRLISKNSVFRGRTTGIGRATAEQAVAWGFTGPCLRASGVPYDVRKAQPYDGYDEFDWEVPYSNDGDTYARYQVRMEEMRQSLRIVAQALADLPDGPVMTSDWHVALPPKEKVYNEMEALIWHFKLVFEGMKVPVGEIYSASEGGNGELGYYVVSDGSPRPYRIKVRPPCFPLFEAFPKLVEGGMVSDAIAVLGSLNIIAGELDR